MQMVVKTTLHKEERKILDREKTLAENRHED